MNVYFHNIKNPLKTDNSGIICNMSRSQLCLFTKIIVGQIWFFHRSIFAICQISLNHTRCTPGWRPWTWMFISIVSKILLKLMILVCNISRLEPNSAFLQKSLVDKFNFFIDQYSQFVRSHSIIPDIPGAVGLERGCLFPYYQRSS